MSLKEPVNQLQLVLDALAAIAGSHPVIHKAQSHPVRGGTDLPIAFTELDGLALENNSRNLKAYVVNLIVGLGTTDTLATQGDLVKLLTGRQSLDRLLERDRTLGETCTSSALTDVSALNNSQLANYLMFGHQWTMKIWIQEDY